MKKTNIVSLAILTLMVGNGASALSSENSVIFTQKLQAGQKCGSIDFIVKEDLGRAAVVVSIQDADNYEGEINTTEHRVLVDGLSYDGAQEAVVLEQAGQRVVCATLEKGLLGLSSSLKKTGNCVFEKIYSTAQEDDGWNIRDVTTLEVSLSVSSSK